MPPVAESAAVVSLLGRPVPLVLVVLAALLGGGGGAGVLRALGSEEAVGAFELRAAEERLVDRVDAETTARSADMQRQAERYDEIIRRLDRIETRMDK